MSSKFTPHYVLTMLQEIKKLSDQDKFNSMEFKKKHPSFYTFRRILISKGLLSKDKGIEKWISIEPNIIMAKSIVRLYVDYLNKLKEERPYTIPKLIKSKNNTEQILKLKRLEIENAFKRKNPTMSLAKEIRKKGESWKDAQKRASIIVKQKKLLDFNTLTLEELDKITNSKNIISSGYKIAHSETEFETLKRKYEQLQEELRKTREQLNSEYKIERIANESYKKRIFEVENQLVENVKTYKQKIESYQIDLQEKNNEIKRKDNMIKDLQNEIELLYAVGSYKKDNEIIDIPEPVFPDANFEEPIIKDFSTSQGIIPKLSKTYKLFGIPVFSIINK